MPNTREKPGKSSYTSDSCGLLFIYALFKSIISYILINIRVISNKIHVPTISGWIRMGE